MFMTLAAVWRIEPLIAQYGQSKYICVEAFVDFEWTSNAVWWILQVSAAKTYSFFVVTSYKLAQAELKSDMVCDHSANMQLSACPVVECHSSGGSITLTSESFNKTALEKIKAWRKKTYRDSRKRREISQRKHKKHISIGRKTHRNQLHQCVQTKDGSFSLGCYLTTSQSLWIRNSMSKKKKKSSIHFKLTNDLRAQLSEIYLSDSVKQTNTPLRKTGLQISILCL